MHSFESDAEIEHVARAVLACTLPRTEWTHAAHFTVAMWVLDNAEMTAERDMPANIRAYNEASGTPNTASSGYHETITMASIRAARAWRASLPGRALHERLRELLRCECGRSDWLLRYWSREALFSPEARRRWVEPDVAPLSFHSL